MELSISLTLYTVKPIFFGNRIVLEKLLATYTVVFIFIAIFKPPFVHLSPLLSPLLRIFARVIYFF